MTRDLSERNVDMGVRARFRREQLDLKPVELAVVLGIGTNRLGQMERNGVDSLRLARQWANALGLDPQDLVFGTPELDAAAGLTKKGA